MPAPRQSLRLTLFVPDLLRPPPPADAFGAGSEADCPTLAGLLARGSLLRQPLTSAEAALAALFGLRPAAPAAALPFATLRLRGENAPAAAPLATQAGWLCADPVHLRLLHDRMVLADSHAFSIDDSEAQALVGRLNKHFAAHDVDPGAEFFAAARDRWYVRLIESSAGTASDQTAGRTAAPDLPPLSEVAGRSLRKHLPETAALAPWRRLLLEAQMLLAADPVNAARAGRGELPLNSLWLWGAGDPATPPAAPVFTQAWTDSPLARGLARHCGSAEQALPASASALLAAGAVSGEQLVVCESLIGPALLDDEAAWCAAVNDLESQWFVPLAAALRGGTLSSLTVVAPTALGLLHWQITPRDHWQFWRRPRALAALARELAASGGANEARNQ
ncbi:hypothetical protein [Rhodocyclus tenuis]|uniref:Phosphoglycerate mutase n=1 Tax=Rhodocyclus tenuis TaxID=1066 RepID=A0A840GEW8_RHOTE|nr:hypothetical protein [Rhodocyclus tenuis]MBB4249178.1 hypothetical protein [Rhodocyclus tenuis]